MPRVTARRHAPAHQVDALGERDVEGPITRHEVAETGVVDHDEEHVRRSLAGT
jgi:DNA-binding transcriptional regulator YdaS (Cro superfamily)